MPDTALLVARNDLQGLFDALRTRGCRIVGPVAGQDAITYDELASSDDLAIGRKAESAPGRYRLAPRNGAAVFADGVGPTPWKRFLYPPCDAAWTATSDPLQFQSRPRADDEAPYAFVGVRPCDLHALAILDRVLSGGEYVDRDYQVRRARALVIAVNCTAAAGTCFCASTRSGPGVDRTLPCDLVLTELANAGTHQFLVEVRSDRGSDVMAGVPHTIADEQHRREAERLVARTADGMTRAINFDGLEDLLYDSYEHPRWDEAAARCLACGNCTAVCPTCFCTTPVDTVDLRGDHADRMRHADSCFTLSFSHLHGGSVRTSIKSRYRHWVIHKLAAWTGQFGTIGCVGCGRCITWCPAGIDITAEVAAIRADTTARPETRKETRSGNTRHDSA